MHDRNLFTEPPPPTVGGYVKLNQTVEVKDEVTGETSRLTMAVGSNGIMVAVSEAQIETLRREGRWHE